MKNLFIISAILIAFGIIFTAAPSGAAKAAATEKLPDFYDDFESYNVTGRYLEEDGAFTEKWANNVFSGGEPLGMDSHIREVGKIEYENGVSGNKVLHLDNTTDKNTFFYMGPRGDYRTKKFTVEFKLKMKVENVVQHCWVGVSFRKKAETFYTGTNNLLFTVVRDLSSPLVYGQGYGIFDGGSATLLSEQAGIYGDKMTYVASNTSVAGNTAGDTGWMDFKLEAGDHAYVLSIDGKEILNCSLDIPTFDYFGYLSLNCCCANALIDDFRITNKDDGLPPVIAPLASPEVVIDTETKKISWSEVPDADSYKIICGDAEKTVAGYVTEYDLTRLRLEEGEYTVTVTAVSPDAFLYKDSAPSNAVRFTIEGEKTSGKKDKKGCGSSMGGIYFTATALLGAFAFIKKNK